MPTNRPDFSDYVAHFTKDRPPFVADDLDAETTEAVAGNANERLVKILEARKIVATPMPWTGRKAVALTECPWSALLDHTRRYSPFGLGFSKAHIFAAGGGPALYVRPDLHTKQKNYRHKDHPEWEGFHAGLYSFVTPFVPSYAPQSYLEEHWSDRPVVDYTHEREWRVPHDFTFQLNQIEFVVIQTYAHMAAFPASLKDGIGRDKFLILEVYEQIERLWPTHLAGGR